MCSIGGYISSTPLDPETVYRLTRALLWYGRSRGSQSSGLYTNGKVLKRAMDPGDFCEISAYFSATRKPCNLALTHTRQPTCGGREKEQAQPFQHNEVTTVHNGFYFDIKGIKDQWDLKKASGVDSELVADFIHAYGIGKLPEFIASTDGPSAIAARVDDKLYLMRAGNPIMYAQFCLADETEILVFASTEQILMDSLRYTWLLNDTITASAVPEGLLIKATPSGLEPLTDKPVGTKEPKFAFGTSHGGRYMGERWGPHGYIDWSDDPDDPFGNCPCQDNTCVKCRRVWKDMGGA